MVSFEPHVHRRSHESARGGLAVFLVLFAGALVSCWTPIEPLMARPAPGSRSAATPSEPAPFPTTRLTVPPCVLLDLRGEPSQRVERCPGVGGYQLLLERRLVLPTVTVLGPRGERWPLNFGSVSEPDSPGLGRDVAWQVHGAKAAVALQLLAPGGEAATWVVAKVTPERACFTDKLAVESTDPRTLAQAMTVATRQHCLPARVK